MEYLASHGYVGDLDRRWQADLRKVILNEFRSDSYRALFYFFERAYWRRLWIVQEIYSGESMDDSSLRGKSFELEDCS
jgi:hypothetical protein